MEKQDYLPDREGKGRKIRRGYTFKEKRNTFQRI